MGNFFSISNLGSLKDCRVKFIYYDGGFVNIDTEIIDTSPLLHIITEDDTQHYVCNVSGNQPFEFNGVPTDLSTVKPFTIKTTVYFKSTTITPGCCWGYWREKKYEYIIVDTDNNEYKLCGPCYKSFC